jgi:hypothetical protein
MTPPEKEIALKVMDEVWPSVEKHDQGFVKMFQIACSCFLATIRKSQEPVAWMRNRERRRLRNERHTYG